MALKKAGCLEGVVRPAMLGRERHVESEKEAELSWQCKLPKPRWVSEIRGVEK